jgi:hypothetical protein
MTDDIEPDLDATTRPTGGAEAAFAVWVYELFEAARDEARRALEQHAVSTPGAERQVVVAAGLASEYLHVATIISVDPVLLADRRHVESVLMMSRHNGEGVIDHQRLRTLTMSDSVALVRTMFPAVHVVADATALLGLRNAAAHTAHVGDGDSGLAVQHLVRIVDALTPLIPLVSRRTFWPSGYEDAIASFRRLAIDALEQRIATRLAAARDRLDTIVFNLDEQEIEAVLRSLERRNRPLVGHTRQQACPACHRDGIIHYQPVVLVNGSPQDGTYEVTREGVPSDFLCPVCGFELDGEMLGSFSEMSDNIFLGLDYADQVLVDPTDFIHYDDDDRQRVEPVDL